VTCDFGFVKGGWKRPSEFVTGAPQMIVEVSPYTIEQVGWPTLLCTLCFEMSG
jgi:hypothetical protein